MEYSLFLFYKIIEDSNPMQLGPIPVQTTFNIFAEQCLTWRYRSFRIHHKCHLSQGINSTRSETDRQLLDNQRLPCAIMSFSKTLIYNYKYKYKYI